MSEENSALRGAIQETLRGIGIPEQIKAFLYLQEAALLAVEEEQEEQEEQWSAQSLYAQVARAHQTTLSRVDRAVRHGLEVSMDRQKGVLNTLVGKPVLLQEEESKREVIGAIAEKALQDCRTPQ